MEFLKDFLEGVSRGIPEWKFCVNLQMVFLKASLDSIQVEIPKNKHL